jgi:phage minor structural protein
MSWERGDTLIKTLNLNRQVTAILENAFDIGYEKTSNSIWQANFSLPLSDPKNEMVKLLQYVEITDDSNGEYIGLFRIIPKLISKENHIITYTCEHVLATLLDSSLFMYHQRYGETTTQVLQYLLSQQKEAHWQLGTVAFTRYFAYSWENENLLSALFSVPKPFDVQYQWTWDTTSYPWTLNLVEPETVATCRIQEGHNLIGFEIEENPMSVFNRIYPLGAGEGVNKLTIKSVNGGIPYIEDAISIAKYGIKETIWVDNRFEDATTLKANAEALLKKWKEPIVTWKASAADVSKITGADIDKLKEGRIVRIDVEGYPTTDLRIMKESKSDITGSPWDVQLEIGSLVEDLSTTLADIQQRQQINELYSAGAVNLITAGYQDNASSTIPALISFNFDSDVVNINTCELTFRTKKFRTYSRITKGGGATVATASSGGGTSTTTESGGGSVKTSAAGGDHHHKLFHHAGIAATDPPRAYAANLGEVGTTQINLQTSRDGHIYTYESSGDHTHTTEIDPHTHAITIDNHSHSLTLSDHTHEVEHDIVVLDELPTSVIIKVDGNTIPHTTTTGDRVDLLDYLEKDTDGRIVRGRHEIEIYPDSLGRIEAEVISRVFIRSHLGTVK